MMHRRAAYIFVGVAGVLLVLGVGYATFASKTVPAQNVNTIAATPNDALAPGFNENTSGVEIPESLKPPRSAPAGNHAYRNEKYRFELFYPVNLTMREFDEGEGASTITFQDVSSAQGFQIFIVPFGGTKISQDRFVRDEPSGVMKNPASIVVDGIPATIFIGKNNTLGDTREVWMLRGGYLYEITAPFPLDDWLGTIMLSWTFI